MSCTPGCGLNYFLPGNFYQDILAHVLSTGSLINEGLHDDISLSLATHAGGLKTADLDLT